MATQESSMRMKVSSRFFFEFFRRYGAEADAVAGPQQRRRIFLRIEQLERRPADHVPAAGRLDRINSGLRSTDRDRAGRDFFARNLTAWRRVRTRQTAGERKA